MCGIFGVIYNDKGEVPFRYLDRMRDLLWHRGPDSSGYYTEHGCALGVNRLAIVDLISGNQPISNENRTLWIAYNGEVYNFEEIRTNLKARGHIFQTRTDTETILHAFEEYGEDCVRLFNGMFAFVIWNTLEKTLFIARDRLGIKPLYIARLDNGLAFASEAKALIHLLPQSVSPNWTAINRYFSFGYIPSPESSFENIEKFPPAHYGWLRGGTLQYTSYWEPIYKGEHNVS